MKEYHYTHNTLHWIESTIAFTYNSLFYIPFWQSNSIKLLIPHNKSYNVVVPGNDSTNICKNIEFNFNY